MVFFLFGFWCLFLFQCAALFRLRCRLRDFFLGGIFYVDKWRREWRDRRVFFPLTFSFCCNGVIMMMIWSWIWSFCLFWFLLLLRRLWPLREGRGSFKTLGESLLVFYRKSYSWKSSLRFVSFGYRRRGRIVVYVVSQWGRGEDVVWERGGSDKRSTFRAM